MDEEIPNDMEKHYKDSRRYEFEGSTDSLWQSDRTEINRNVKLYLKNMPRELNQNGLRNICAQYGRVKEIFYPRDKLFAFVTYESLSEAENAKRQLNEDLNLSIKAEFAIEKEKREKEIILNSEFDQMLNDATKKENNQKWNDVLQMDKRVIKGPFSAPVKIEHQIIRLIYDKDYKNSNLLIADPSNDFLWDSNEEEVVPYETDNRKIVHGFYNFTNTFETNIICITFHIIRENYTLAAKLKAMGPLTLGKCIKEKNAFVWQGDPKSMLTVPQCSYCHSPADKQCDNCEMPFCSLACRKSDEAHAIICANAQHKIVEINSDKTEPLSHSTTGAVETVPQLIITNSQVKVTCVVNHKMVFVRPSGGLHDIVFANMLNEAVRCAKTATTLVTLPFVGTMVLAPFGGFYQRALVLKVVSEKEIVVAFIDFGNVESVKLNELKIISHKLKTTKRLATKIMLKDVTGVLLNDKALIYLYKMVAHDIELKITFDSGCAELFSTTSTKSVNKTIIDLNSLEAELKYQSLYADNSIETTKFEGKDVHVLILDNSLLVHSDITFIQITSIDQFLRNDAKVQSFCQSLYANDDTYTPRYTENCLVRWNEDKKWYRATCVEVCFDGHVTVFFIDYGNINIVKITDIRRIPTPLLFPSITGTATLSNENAEKNVVRLQQMLPNLSKQQFKELKYEKQDGNEVLVAELPATLFA